MCTASSAARTWRAPASASEYTATVRMPRRRALRKMRQAISPRFATSRLLINVPSPAALHAEHTVRGALLGCVAHRRQRQRQDPSGIGGIDHAIVPQARRGVVGMSLALVLLA